MLDSQKTERRKSNNTTMENQVTKEGSKRGRKEKENYKIARQQLVRWYQLSPYLSVIILNVNGPNSLGKRHRVADWIEKARPNCMLPTRDPLQL